MIHSMYVKNFEGWNKRKQNVEKILAGPPFFAEREIWWCAFGVNIGAEMDGKNGNYERPGLILKYINASMAFVAPLTSTFADNRYTLKIETKKTKSFVKIAQMRPMSSKRFLRKMDILSEEQFAEIRKSILDLFS